MSDDNPWLPSTVIKDGETITGMAEPLDIDKVLSAKPVIPDGMLCTCGHMAENHKDGEAWASAGCHYIVGEGEAVAFCQCKGFEQSAVEAKPNKYAALLFDDVVSTGNNKSWYWMSKYFNVVGGGPFSIDYESTVNKEWLTSFVPAAQPKYPELAEPSGEVGAAASDFTQHHWGTPNIAINNISVTKLLAGYVQFISKDLTAKIMADIKKKQRDACVPPHKKNARKFRAA